MAPALIVKLTRAERAIVDQLRAAAGLDDGNLVRLALWKLARHYALPDLPGAFDIRRQGTSNDAKHAKRTRTKVPRP